MSDIPNAFLQQLLSGGAGVADDSRNVLLQALFAPRYSGTSSSQSSMHTQNSVSLRSDPDKELEGEERTSKMRKTMSKTGEVKKNGTPNKRWSKEEAAFLIEFLVEQASKGMKAHKNFKKPAFVAAAAAVNDKFGQNFNPLNVENHLKGLKAKWKEICTCRELSGAGWHDGMKMIELDGPTYDTYVAAHPERAAYINKPIKHYDSLRIICGEDHATGSFLRGLFRQYPSEEDSYNIDDESPLPDPLVESLNIGEESGWGTQAPVPPPSTSSGKPLKSGSKKRGDSKREVATLLMEGLSGVADAIKQSSNAGWRKRLSDIIMATEGFTVEELEEVYDEMVKDKDNALAFLEKLPERQVKLVADRIMSRTN